MLRPKRKFAIVAIASALGLSLLLAIVLLLPDRTSLPALQKKIEETGTCSVSAQGIEFVIQADTARIENDTLILERNATAGDNAWIVVSANARSIYARSVSLRFITSPKDTLELTFHDLQSTGTVLYKVGTATMKYDRHWTLRQWLHHVRRKLRNTFK
jgi:hypothetical protein